MRALLSIGLVLAVVGCKKSGGTSAVIAGLPEVTAAGAGALATTDGPVPKVVVVLGADGSIRVADTPKTWDKLAAGNPSAVKPIDARMAYQIAREARELNMPVKQLLKHPDLMPGDMDDKDTISYGAQQDDPPPPPPDEPDDGDSGGTGTAMALEEGKIAAAKNAGILGRTGRGAFGDLGDTGQGGVLPSRAADVVGEIPTHAQSGRDHAALIMAAPHAKATALITALAETRGLIAVAYQGKVRALRLDIPDHSARMQPGADTPAWIEVRVTAAGVDIEAVPDEPTAVPWAGNGAVDAAAIAKAYQATQQRSGVDATHPVDLLVASDTDVQRVVDLVVALDGGGAKVIGLGSVPAPGDPEAKKRGKLRGTVQLGDPETSEDVDVPALRAEMQSRLRGIGACYSGLLGTSPDAAGSVEVRFYIESGSLYGGTATGVDEQLDDCITNVMAGMIFPTMAGVSASVSYPITLTK